MRTVRYSLTFNSQFTDLLDFGATVFGAATVAKKQYSVYATVADFLAIHPYSKRPDPKLGLCIYPISRTPFVVLYVFDDAELRVHFIFHRNASLADLDPTSAEW